MPNKKPQKRNTVRVLISLYPEDLRVLDAIALRLKEPEAEPNRSHAVRFAIRECAIRETLEAPAEENPGHPTG